MSKQNWTELCEKVLQIESHNSDVGFAKSYARAGKSMVDRKERSYQAAYILSNLRYWRGEEARRIKAELKKYAEDKSWR